MATAFQVNNLVAEVVDSQLGKQVILSFCFLALSLSLSFSVFLCWKLVICLSFSNLMVFLAHWNTTDYKIQAISHLYCSWRSNESCNRSRFWTCALAPMNFLSLKDLFWRANCGWQWQRIVSWMRSGKIFLTQREMRYISRCLALLQYLLEFWIIWYNTWSLL